MKKILGVVLLSLFWCNLSLGVSSTYKVGKGPLKVNQHMADVLEYFFSGGTMGKYKEEQNYIWKPGIIVITLDGTDFSYYRHPAHVNNIDNARYVAQARQQCLKKSGKECFLFAKGYRILWDNGSDKKKRKLKRKDIKAGKTLQILQELGFYDSGNTSSAIKPKITKKSEDNDVVTKLKDLKKLLDDGVISKEEFEKAKKKILN